MGYKVLASLKAGGKKYQAGEAYAGPSELVEGLVKMGILAEDKAMKIQPGSAEPISPRGGKQEDDLDLDEKPQKAKKGKGK